MDSCLIIAGEKSAEEHALSFFPVLKKYCPDVHFYGVGGDELARHEVELLYHFKDFSSMGFSEVFKKIPFYFKALKNIELLVQKKNTKVAILIDFQDFNMRLAKALKKRGVSVLYYVAPQAWVWRPGRTKALVNNVHTLFTILPFEKDWFYERGVKQVKSVAHPLVNHFQQELKNIPLRPFGCWSEGLKILLLPGSRKFEVQSLLPEFIEAIKILKKYFKVEVHLVKVDHLENSLYQFYNQEIDFFYDSKDISVAMKTCHFAFAASGTVTLSTGLFELPTVVCYKAGLLNEFVFFNLINYAGFISLTNIIHHRKIFPELLQGSVTSHYLAHFIKTWTSDETLYNEIKGQLKLTKNKLSGEPFSVSQYMAGVIHERSHS